MTLPYLLKELIHKAVFVQANSHLIILITFLALGEKKEVRLSKNKQSRRTTRNRAAGQSQVQSRRPAKRAQSAVASNRFGDGRIRRNQYLPQRIMSLVSC